MLQQLFIQNIVIIESLHLDFTADLTVFTGETGAGKSILLDSLGLILGDKAETKLIREGSEQATVTASFSLPASHPIFDVLSENGIPFEKEEPLMIRRTLARNGNNKIFINDNPVSVQLLKTISSMLVDIHGQFDTYSLMDEKTHRQIVDRYGVDKKLLEELKMAWDTWQSTKKHYEETRLLADKEKQDEDYYHHVYEELKNFAPQHGEEELLEQKKQEHKNRSHVLEALQTVEGCLNGEQGADIQIGHATKTLERIAKNLSSRSGENRLDDLLDKMSALQNQMADIVFAYQALFDHFTGDEENPDVIAERLLNLRELARKHQCSADALPQKMEEIAQKLQNIATYDELLERLEKQMTEEKKIYFSLAEKAHEARAKVAQEIDKRVMDELSPLKMEKARFQTLVQKLGENEANAFGVNSVSFQISTNPGSPFGALKKVASGGELSRFMLALKVVLAKTEICPTFIFDEVDSGIGGATAHAVGERLKLLSQEKQVLVITHSPQVAACGLQHFHVSKTSAQNKTSTQVKILSSDERLQEIARMLSGAQITDEAFKAAEKLLVHTQDSNLKKTAI